MPYTDEQAVERARALAPLYGLSEEQLPTGAVFSSTLNGVEACQKFIEAYPQLETPGPQVQLVPAPTVEPGSKGLE